MKLIREMIEDYDIDVLDLDFWRNPYCFPEDGKVDEHCDTMTAFVREVHGRIQKSKKKIALLVRDSLLGGGRAKAGLRRREVVKRRPDRRRDSRRVPARGLERFRCRVSPGRRRQGGGLCGKRLLCGHARAASTARDGPLGRPDARLRRRPFGQRRRRHLLVQFRRGPRGRDQTLLRQAAPPRLYPAPVRGDWTVQHARSTPRTGPRPMSPTTSPCTNTSSIGRASCPSV